METKGTISDGVGLRKRPKHPYRAAMLRSFFYASPECDAIAVSASSSSSPSSSTSTADGDGDDARRRSRPRHSPFPRRLGEKFSTILFVTCAAILSILSVEVGTTSFVVDEWIRIRGDFSPSYTSSIWRPSVSWKSSATKPRIVTNYRHLRDIEEEGWYRKERQRRLEVDRTLVDYELYEGEGSHLPVRRESFLSHADQLRNPDLNEDCQLRYGWQKEMHPNCNDLHDFDWTSPFISDETNVTEHFRILRSGYWRDVWLVRRIDYGVHGESGRNVVRHVLKSIRYQHDLSPRNYDRMRRDALVMERLTSSRYVVDIHAFCGTSSVSEYAEGGDILAALWPRDGRPPLSPMQKLHIATQAAMGLAALHNADVEGHPSVAHTDVSAAQFLSVDGTYKLNDFNRARFIPWSSKNDTACSYRVGNNPGKNRSPEEYLYLPQTEKVDIYSYGNVLYLLLLEDFPFREVSIEDAQSMVIDGIRPGLYVDILNGTDPITVVLRDTMMMCHRQDPADRPSAREIEKRFKDVVRTLDPGRLEAWGET